MSKIFQIDLRKAEALADSALAQNPHSVWALYAKGASLATLGSFYLKTGSYWKGARISMGSLDFLRKCNRLDTTVTDAYLYLGLWDYAKAEIQRRLFFILFWQTSEGKTKGIRKLELCRTKSVFSRLAAAQVLLGIYAREKQYEKAKALLHQILAEYPNNRPACWTWANHHFEQKNWSQASQAYAEILNRLPRSAEAASWQSMHCLHRLALCQYHLASYKESKKHCELALQSNHSNDKRSQDIRQNVRKLLRKIQTRR